MTKDTSSVSTIPTPTLAQVDACIAQARQMRSDYMAKAMASGLARLRAAVLHAPIAAPRAGGVWSANS